MGRRIDGNELGRLLFVRGMSQGEFAEVARLTAQTISCACKGGPISPKSFWKITRALQVTADRVDDPNLAA